MSTSAAPTPSQDNADLNTRQWRFVDFAVRKSLHWERASEDPGAVILTTGTDSHRLARRHLVLYRSGRTGTGIRVALIDPASTDPERALTWLTQREAWAMVADGRLR